jgi:pimeloyl-ACP methyl ester carboxylesterase
MGGGSPAESAPWAGAALGSGDKDDPEATAVLLIHSSGGGAFAWREVMGELAARCGVRVIALDRPAFGLTSRPHPPPAGSGLPNPYAPASQAALALQLCSALGVRRAMLVAHGDGCVVAVMAAALARRCGPKGLQRRRGRRALGWAAARRGRGRARHPSRGRPLFKLPWSAC